MCVTLEHVCYALPQAALVFVLYTRWFMCRSHPGWVGVGRAPGTSSVVTQNGPFPNMAM